MQRYFIDSSQINNTVISITGDDAHHISRVMRMGVNEEVICCNEKGKSYLCVIEAIEGNVIVLNIKEELSEDKELPVHVTIAQGMPKADKLEYIVQKGTELGANGFLPFFASRSIVKWDEKKGRKKQERLRKIAKEAAEQSHRQTVPVVNEPASFNKMLSFANEADVKIVAYEEDAKIGESSNLANALKDVNKDDKIVLVVGPEGGLTEDEVAQLKSEGFITCAFGPRILRTETAPLYFLSAVSYQIELLR
ncbi:16S rRNA (uracil(1498)-N(3))-methyltransferase [Bacillus solimangrovi]|uniref:Ribosomal RNA small subunit methyltransferase E n=1 Tax=Bacillus solimangrovi TaxID=1305675 RepID=A0A1E5LHX8_9BACI|nr:16S rRNA (uracil(1498)-N(3))-methyltransferase [Bacillus solimangrovi]OEH93694.1 16S rRNA (uracil(1498)-N(3))-methyltransferase [Bacillus solimangrovi]